MVGERLAWSHSPARFAGVIPPPISMRVAPLRRGLAALAFSVLLLSPDASAQDAREAVAAEFGAVERSVYAADRDSPTFLAGDLGRASAGDVAGFFRDHAAAFGFASAPELRVERTETDDLGMTHVRVRQTVDGVPVWTGDGALHIRDGRAVAWGGDLHPGADAVDTRPVLDADASLMLAKRDLGPVEFRDSVPADAFADAMDWTPTADLVVYPHDDGYRLAYHVRLFVDAPHPANWEVFVDAKSGDVLHRFNSIHTFDPRVEATVAASGVPYARQSGASALAFVAPETGSGSSLYSGTVTIPTYSSGGTYYLYDTTRGPSYIRTMTGNNGTSLPGSYITDSDNNFTASAARAGVDAHYGQILTYDYFKNTHGRNGYNGSNASMTSTVHHRSGYNNAFWNGQQMVYGDGDGYTFGPLVELDIAAHELTHAVTEYTAGLVYQKESGALNESVSDIFAVMVDRNDWTLGENSYTPGTSGDALRSLSNPPAEGQPDHYDDRLYPGSCSPSSSNDYCGVHTNSGIPNKAAYLMAAGGTHEGVTVSSIGRDATERIWYRALANYFTSSTTFSAARAGTIQAASDLYGSGSSQVTAVTNAWAAVGVGSSSGGGGGGGGGGTAQWYYESANLQTPHNYPNNYNSTHTYTKSGAQQVAMYFAQFELENNYDFVYIKDAGNTTRATYTGTRSGFWAVVDGSTIKSNIVTDYSVTDYGYRVTQVAYYSTQALMTATGESDATPLAEAPVAPPSDVLGITPAKAEALVLDLAVGPNPATSVATVGVSLPEAGAARVAVLDLLGREVAAPHDGRLQAGRTDVALDTSALPAGVYVVVLDVDGQRLTRQLTVVR